LNGFIDCQHVVESEDVLTTLGHVDKCRYCKLGSEGAITLRTCLLVFMHDTCLGAPRGAPYKGIIRSQKREKSTCFFVGQRYYWTKGLRIELLASLHGSIGFEVSSVKNAQKVFPRLDLLAGWTAGTVYWLATANGFAFNMAASAPPCLRRGNRARSAVCDSASTYLVVCRFNPSTYRGLAFFARLDTEVGFGAR